MRIAVLSSRFPFPLERGDKLRLFHQIKVLSQHHEVYLFSVCDQHPSDKELEELRPYCKEMVLHKLTLLEKVLSFWYALRYKWPIQASLSFSPKFSSLIINQIKTLGIDMVYCQLIRMAPYAQKIMTNKVLDYMDAFGVGMERRAQISFFPLNFAYLFESKRVKAYEQKMFMFFNAATIITDNDKSLLPLSHNSKLPIAIVSNGIDSNYFHPQIDQVKEFDLGFIGNLGYLPNIEAIRHLCQKILPLYFQKYHYYPSVLIAGARPGDDVLQWQSDRISILGWQEDIRNAYGKIRILCAPIWSGTGQQNKVLEAMSSCIPVVCTEEVNKGIGAIHHNQLMVAKTDEEMVAYIFELLTNRELYLQLASNGRSFVKEKYNWDKTTLPLLELFQNKDIA